MSVLFTACIYVISPIQCFLIIMKFLVLKNDFYNLVEMLYFLATSQLSQMTGVPLKITYCKRVSSCPNLVLPHRDMLLKWPHRAQILHYKQTYILTCNNFRPYIVFVHLVASIQGTDFLNTILRIQGRRIISVRTVYFAYVTYSMSLNDRFDSS